MKMRMAKSTKSEPCQKSIPTDNAMGMKQHSACEQDSNRGGVDSLDTLTLTRDLVWTVADAARFLKCSAGHIRNLVSQGKIPFSKVGELVRFSPERIREWLYKGGTR